MKKIIFRKQDKVFDIRYGWGIVIGYNNDERDYPISVEFDLRNGSKGVERYTSGGKNKIYDNIPMLSFTEYSLQDFSQKRNINEDFIGKWGAFYDAKHKKSLVYKFGKLECIQNNNIYRFKPEDCIAYYEFFEPFTEEQIEFLGLTDKNVDNEEHI